MLDRLRTELDHYSNKEQAEILSRFFKTGKGEYGEGDKFLGIKVPVLRKVVKSYGDMNPEELQKLIESSWHEHRLAALFILTAQFNKSDEEDKQKKVDFYLKNTRYINNWDLVDLSADKIIGNFLYGKDTKMLDGLAASSNLWERRIAILSTFAFIRRKQFEDTLRLSLKLLHDQHDLIHKAVGWMLREVGKRDLKTEEIFLQKHYHQMPRTMLRYAIEKFEENKRKEFLKK